MLSPDELTLIGVAVTGLCSVGGVIAGVLGGRRATLSQATSASQNAANETKKAITADWAAFTELLQERLVAVEARAAAAEQRIAASETRADIAERRAEKSEELAAHWESLYRSSTRYIADLMSWATSLAHLGAIPEPPTELRADL